MNNQINDLISSLTPEERLEICNFRTSTLTELVVEPRISIFGNPFKMVFYKKKKYRFLKVFLKCAGSRSPLPMEIRIIEEEYFNRNYQKHFVIKTEFYSEEEI